jgi:hypothetical protein
MSAAVNGLRAGLFFFALATLFLLKWGGLHSTRGQVSKRVAIGHDRDFGRRFGFGFGGYYPYDYYDNYPYDDSYYDNGNCYVVQRRVHTTHGWRLQPVQVCG